MSAAWGPALRVVRRVVPAAALAVVFLLALLASVVLHLNTNAGRRLVARQTGALVSRLLVAGLVIERLDVLSPGRLAVSRATLLDRLGKPLLRAEGLDVRFGLVELVRGILGKASVRVMLPEVRAERVSVWLTRDPRGGLTLETAFDTRGPKSSGPSTPVVVSLPRIFVATALVSTDLPGIEHATGTVTRLAAGLDVSSAGVILSLKSDDARIAHLLPEELRGRLDAELRLPGTTRADLDAHAGTAPLTARLRWQGRVLELAARSDELTPGAMRRLLASWPLLVPLRASARAEGEPAAMRAAVEGSAGPTRLTGTGSLRLAPDVGSDLDVHVDALDLRLFDATAPATALALDARVSLALAEGGVTVGAKGTLPALTIAGHALPPLSVAVSYARDRLTGTASVLAPGLASDASFELSPEHRLSFDANAKGLELRELAPYGVEAEGRAALRVKGVLERGRLTTDVAATLDAPRAGGVRAENVTVRARIDGPVARPEELRVELVADGTKLDAAGVKLGRFHATASGSLARSTVTLAGATPGGVTLDASAALAARTPPTLRDVRLESSRGSADVRITAARVVFEAGGVRVDELALHAGKGEVTGSLAVIAGRTELKLATHRLELGSLLAAFGLPSGGIAGRLDGHVDFAELGHDRHGNVHVELHDGGRSVPAGRR